jgi:hypothetical protein
VSDCGVVHLLLPAGYDDSRRTSGGNVYDQHLVTGLAAGGLRVVVHDVADGWPVPGAAVGAAVERALALVPDGQVVIVDGLLATAGAVELRRHADRVVLVLLVHMPEGPGGPPATVLHCARLLITTSAWTATTLIQAHALATERVVVAPPGAPVADVATGTTTGGSLLCVAAVSQPKGHDLLFGALAALRDRDWTCHCVGALDRDVPFVKRERDGLLRHGISDRVQFPGELAGAALDRVYDEADVLVLPTRQESYGIVVGEALARGLPVIASSVGGVPQALGRAPDGRRPGILVDAEDEHALRDALARWLDLPDLRDELRVAARGRRSTLSGWAETVTTVTSAVKHLGER